MLTGIWRYPIKSMGGEELDRSEVSSRGLFGDRTWAVVESSTGMICSAKHPGRWGQLLSCRAWLFADGHNVGLTLPDGQEISSLDPSAADHALSQLLDRDISLRHNEHLIERAIERTDPLLGDVDGSGPLDLGEVVGFELGSAAIGSLFDFAPAHVITNATLSALANPLGVDVGEMRARLRPNLIFDLDEALSGEHAKPFEENNWPDSHLRLGDMTFEVVLPTPRCIVPTLAQADFEPNPDVARTLAGLNRVEVTGFGRLPVAGAYVVPRRGGGVEIGDATTLTQT